MMGDAYFVIVDSRYVDEEVKDVLVSQTITAIKV